MTKTITLIGCGRWGANILRDLRQMNIEVIVIEPQLNTHKTAVEKGASKIYFSLDDFLETKTHTDAFIIAASSCQHYPLLLALKDLKQPVFVEKPMVLTTDEAHIIIKHMSDRVFVMHKWRYHPGVHALKALIKSEQLGELKSISTIRHGLLFDYDIPGYRILLPHDLSIILELLNLLPTPDNATPLIDNNQMVGLTANFNASPSIQMSICTTGQTFQREITLGFEKGTASLSDKDYHHVCVYNQSNQLSEKIKLDDCLPLKKELETFCNYLDGGPKPKSSATDSLKIIACTEQLLQLTEKQIEKSL